MCSVELYLGLRVVFLALNGGRSRLQPCGGESAYAGEWTSLRGTSELLAVLIADYAGVLDHLIERRLFPVLLLWLELAVLSAHRL